MNISTLFQNWIEQMNNNNLRPDWVIKQLAKFNRCELCPHMDIPLFEQCQKVAFALEQEMINNEQ